ncbi:polyprenyl synthetase family protein [Cellulomonas composti]|uniref:Geranylgeranyl pyrophosphate synthase n=1 Tax=Cellulomonas composti TaxID=266130 RepID=A0A511J6U0_9CELL|nr:polyprenyl synthetase family protein [Cellulomonas composti]GEL93717.1 geranylgeranyl pyrophosphate synthase [Cellulomonas composti]
MHAPSAGDAELPALREAMAAACSGGRRLRPALVAAAYRAYGGTDPAPAAHVGEAVELLHGAFVMHDDVIDHDEVRRGRPNVVGTFARRARGAGAAGGPADDYARAAGILAGDLALVAAARGFATTPAPAPVVARLLDLLDEAVTASAAGELRDVRLALRLERPDLAETLAVTHLKTAAYSFCLPLRAGALLAGADDTALVRLDELGRLAGVAFQLQDDLVGVFGDPRVTGKSALGDLREGKVTALVAHAATTPWWTRIEPHLGDPDLSTAQAGAVRRALEDCGARAFVAELAAAHLGAARDLAARAGLPDELLVAVLGPVATLVERAA